ncbi:FxLYD domain-containing protein [Halomarina salina]|uniref:FxLYD domain-containing protein n=1 Tax=Halomarina salina TaxID=1872699 RepID=A0ABD5RHI1_9EURY|nr:FxLYD domain-containing protein [Halomarina salina]
MNRRRYLALTGALTTTALAGCSESGETSTVDGGKTADPASTDTETPAPTSGTENDVATERATETETEPETATPTGEAALEVISEELVVDEGEYSTDVYVAAEIENTADVPSGLIELKAEWFDGDGNYLDNSTQYLRTLGAGETWNARVYALMSDGEKIEDYSLGGEFQTQSPNFSPEGLALGETELKVGDNDAVVNGGVQNNRGEEVGYIQAIAKFYNADGAVVGTGRDNVLEVPADRTWSFEASWLGYGDRLGDIDDFEVVITDSPY